MLDQHSQPEKLSPLGGEFITRSSLNLLSGFLRSREKHREDLLKLPGWVMSPCFILQRSAQIHGSPWGCIGKQYPTFGKCCWLREFIRGLRIWGVLKGGLTSLCQYTNMSGHLSCLVNFVFLIAQKLVWLKGNILISVTGCLLCDIQ